MVCAWYAVPSARNRTRGDKQVSMSWDVTLCKAPADAVGLDDLPDREDDGPGDTLGTEREVVERLQQVLPGAWFESDDTGTWGGVDEDAYGLRVYLIKPDAPPSGSIDVVERVCLSFQSRGDPHRDMDHPVWRVIAAACEALQCRAEDDGFFLGSDGRPIESPRAAKRWWQVWR